MDRATNDVPMKHTIETDLDLADSKRALDHAMNAYKERFAEYNPHFRWVTETRGEFGFSARGMSLEGSLVIQDRKVDVDMDVPFLFMIFQGRAMKVIEDQVNLWVAKVKAGEV